MRDNGDEKKLVRNIKFILTTSHSVSKGIASLSKGNRMQTVVMATSQLKCTAMNYSAKVFVVRTLGLALENWRNNIRSLYYTVMVVWPTRFMVGTRHYHNLIPSALVTFSTDRWSQSSVIVRFFIWAQLLWASAAMGTVVKGCTGVSYQDLGQVHTLSYAH